MTDVQIFLVSVAIGGVISLVIIFTAIYVATKEVENGKANWKSI